jgi:hypothetical protein
MTYDEEDEDIKNAKIRDLARKCKKLTVLYQKERAKRVECEPKIKIDSEPRPIQDSTDEIPALKAEIKSLQERLGVVCDYLR